MKVTTDIHAGNVIDDASQAANSVVDQAKEFVSSANLQAEDIKNKAGGIGNHAWTTLTGLFSSNL